ncbi:ROK family transcriptional regulator [Sphingomonas sp. PAMC 26617]|uniref:ROK family transcriptional regulator n=1 Tax=Sphingomonas sp. PAMC 26617 TaxID=1112216 RepID=UPI0002E39530|nr:ROK family transcriptional regulator [Sphingomonas sp. PAMC 26617]
MNYAEIPKSMNMTQDSTKAFPDLSAKARDIGDPLGAQSRSSRLSNGLSGTNLERAGDYNLRTVLQAIRLRDETTRVTLVQETGLTAPTIANITNRLIDKGLVRLSGRTKGGRGQPALKLQIDPDGAFGIGLNVDRDHLTLVALDLAGEVRSRITQEIAFAMPADVVEFVKQRLDEVIAAGNVDRERVLGVGVAMPDDLGSITLPGSPPEYSTWDDVAMPALLREVLPWPIHTDNDAAAAALGEAQCGTATENPSFFYLLISAGLGGGLVIDRSYHRGATSRSGEIGLMPDPGASTPGAVVQDIVSLSTLHARLAAAECPVTNNAKLVGSDAAVNAVLEQWLIESVRALTMPLIGINCVLNPDAILIGGRLPVPLIERLASKLEKALSAIALPSHARIMSAVMAQDAPAIGAATLPFLDHVLPSDAILIKVGR